MKVTKIGKAVAALAVWRWRIGKFKTQK